jgi:hypothetical protein
LLRSGVIFLGSINVIPPVRGISFALGRRNPARCAQFVYSVLFYVIFSKKATANQYKPLVFVETCGSMGDRTADTERELLHVEFLKKLQEG